jgi:alkaline phosphatase D
MKQMITLILLSCLIQTVPLFSQGFSLAFGSCLHQEKELALLSKAKAQSPNAFVFLGDNIYADTYDSMQINAAYQSLACNPNFQALKRSVSLYATWDDHDYGMDDVGKYYPLKEASKRMFTSFFQPPNLTQLLSHQGIYQSYLFRYRGKKIQLILLDTRTFRSSLKRINKPSEETDTYYPYERLYLPVYTEDSSMLGEGQWAWLAEQLKVKSAVTIIGSSTQYATEYNGYETWANFPLEQERMVQLIESMRKEHVVFISGDVHYAELSKVCNASYPLYDLTSSGISESWGFAAPNVHREEGPVMENNFGILRIQPWRNEITFLIYTEKGLRLQRTIYLDELEFK